MEVEAIYDRGKLQFVKPLKLKHDRVRLVITVPDDEVEVFHHHVVSADVVQRARAMREQLDAIRNAPLRPDDQLLDLTQKRLDRIKAFGLREDR